MTDVARIVDHIRGQAVACKRLGSPLYAGLIASLADDLEQGGPAADVVAGYGGDPGLDAVALRVMGGVHRLVQRRAPVLALFYPSVGGTADVGAAWPALREVLMEHRDELRQQLRQAPQTNEVGRAAALVGGLHHIVASRPGPVRLVEIGASAGLNLLADRFRVVAGDGHAVGPSTSPVMLADAWHGPLPPLAARPDVVERFGCDTAPLDATSVEGRLRLTSYVWPDQRARLERLRGALAIAQDVPVVLERSGAADYLTRLDLVPGTTTVLWHSVMWQYLSRDEQAVATTRIGELGAQADATAGFAHLRLEPENPPAEAAVGFRVVLRSWPGGEERVLGTAAPHGLPTTWE